MQEKRGGGGGGEDYLLQRLEWPLWADRHHSHPSQGSRAPAQTDRTVVSRDTQHTFSYHYSPSAYQFVPILSLEVVIPHRSRERTGLQLLWDVGVGLEHEECLASFANLHKEGDWLVVDRNSNLPASDPISQLCTCKLVRLG